LRAECPSQNGRFFGPDAEGKKLGGNWADDTKTKVSQAEKSKTCRHQWEKPNEKALGGGGGDEPRA